MALSFQLMSTLGKDSDSVVRTLDHKYEAIHLYRGALSRSETRNLALLDTLLILITLEVSGLSSPIVAPGLSRYHRPLNAPYPHGAYTLPERTV